MLKSASVPAQLKALHSVIGIVDIYYTFTVTVCGGQSRYGIQIGHDRGTVWESTSQMKTEIGIAGCSRR